MQQNNTAPTANNSEGDNMLSIQTLTSQVEQLERTSGWWNNVTLWLVAGTAIVAALYFITSLISSSKSNALKNAQANLIRAKDEQLVRDLKDKDEHIAEADKKAAEANAVAAKANEGLAKSNEEISQLNAKAEALRNDAEQAKKARTEAEQQIAALNAEAAKAREGIANTQIDTAKANEAAASANERAEIEALKRVEMEKSLARRTIPLVVMGGKWNTDPLKPFAGIQVIVEYLPELEPYRAALEVRALADSVGWKVVKFAPQTELADPRWDGVTVQWYWPGMPKDPNQFFQNLRAEEKPKNAATALVEFLKLNNWGADSKPSSLGEIPPDTIRVRVGLKPEPYSITKAEEEFEEKVRKTPNQPLPQRRTTPRHITLEVGTRLLKSLEATPFFVFGEDARPTIISCPEGNNEACEFADEIAELLRELKWPLQGTVVRDKNFPRMLKGILIRERWENQSESAGLWYRAFKAAGFEVKRESEPYSPTEPMQILVGW